MTRATATQWSTAVAVRVRSRGAGTSEGIEGCRDG